MRHCNRIHQLLQSLLQEEMDDGTVSEVDDKNFLVLDGAGLVL